MKQNIYDNEQFFSSYKALRDTDNNFNVLLEQPSIRKLIPNIKDKAVLDLGCGFGNNCMDFVNLGAKSVVGIDISEKMLSVAKNKNNHLKINYLNLPLEDLNKLDDKVDFIYSSLCFHYIKDFDKLIKDIYNHLNDRGVLLFSQEHPVVTASAGIADRYIFDENGNMVYCLCNYQDEAQKRIEDWYIDGVIKYHRTFSTIINTLCDVGFIIQKVVEPVPDEYATSKRPGIKKEFIKPSFLIVKAIKK